MRLLRAVGAAVTAFVDELSPYDFPLFADVADALEDAPKERVYHRGALVDLTDSSCAEAAAEEVPGAVQLPEATAPGQPNDPETHAALCAVAAKELRECAVDLEPRVAAYWNWIATELTK